MKTIYLDHGSTSFPKAPGVGKAMMELLSEGGFNIGRGGYESAYSLAERVLGIRKQVSDFFGFETDSNVIFTPNVTFSLNFLISGLLKAGDHVITTTMEHNAVARPLEAAKRRGVEISYAQADAMGGVEPEQIEALIRSNTRVVVMLHGSNVSGTLLPISNVGKICKQKGIFFAVDAAQTAGVVPIDMKAMGIDALAFTGHKGLLGPQGIGGLLLVDELADVVDPMLFGGTGSLSDSLEMPGFLPDKLEPGTLNLPGIIGLSAALDYINEVGIDHIRSTELSLALRFLESLADRNDVKVIGRTDLTNRCPIVSLDFLNKDNAEIAYRLDQEFGIMTRCGLHCAPLAHRSLGTFPSGTVRFSFGHTNTAEEVDRTIEAINKI